MRAISMPHESALTWPQSLLKQTVLSASSGRIRRPGATTVPRCATLAFGSNVDSSELRRGVGSSARAVPLFAGCSESSFAVDARLPAKGGQHNQFLDGGMGFLSFE